MAHQTGNLPKKEEIQQQLPITAIQHYRPIQQQRRATTTTTPLTHLQKTDMITTMSRGNQEDRVGSVQDRQEDQEEVEEEEEEMKTEKLEGKGNIGTESTENVSNGAISGESSGEISEVSSTQKRTDASLNSAQASGNKASTHKKTLNIAQAVSIGVAKGVANDSKQAQTQHLAMRGLIESVSTRVNTIYNRIYKATFIPNRRNIKSNDNSSDNDINGVDIFTENEGNNNLANSSDNNIIIYDASGVDNIIQIGENINLVNNITVCININDNISVLDGEENTPGEVNSKLKLELESVDSYPLNLQTEIPILRRRGGVGEEEKQEQTAEETLGERSMLTTLDEEESEAIGGRMEDAKLPGMIHISGCNQMESKHIN
jgi:hypothetical protein